MCFVVLVMGMVGGFVYKFGIRCCVLVECYLVLFGFMIVCLDGWLFEFEVLICYGECMVDGIDYFSLFFVCVGMWVNFFMFCDFVDFVM